MLDPLLRGRVPQQGLDLLAVGLDRFTATVDGELAAVSGGESAFKAVRGDYDAGKTFFARWLEERAKLRGLAVAEVQVSETETPLHSLETVYRRLAESLAALGEMPADALAALDRPNTFRPPPARGHQLPVAVAVGAEPPGLQHP